MAEEYPQVTKWTTFFLYPFSFPAQQKDALSATLQKAIDRWRRSGLRPLIHSFLQEIGGAPPSQLLDSHFLSNAQRRCLA